MNSENKDPIIISKQALQRMPYYLQYLKQLQQNDVEVVSAPSIASYFNLKEIQVRKDLSAVCVTKGKPKAGFNVIELISGMENFLGYHNSNDAVIVGAGQLGRALLSYKGFDAYGLNIVAAFDSNADKINSEIANMKILPVNKLSEICRRLNIHIGIITVPAEHAQIVCDQLVSAGIRAIWNFAPTHLFAPKDILIQNENMAASLALLSKHFQNKSEE